MDKPAAFMGDFVDARFMRGLKVMRLYVDVPIEHSNRVLEAFGAPSGVSPAKVAIALIDQEALTRREEIGPRSGEVTPAIGQTQAEPAKSEDKPRTPFRDLPRRQQAAIKCQDRVFGEWLVTQYIARVGHDDDGNMPYGPDLMLKRILGISSKKELDTNPEKAAEFDRLLATFDVRDLVR